MLFIVIGGDEAKKNFKTFPETPIDKDITPHVEISKKKYDEKLAKMMSSIEKPSSGEEKEDRE